MLADENRFHSYAYGFYRILLNKKGKKACIFCININLKNIKPMDISKEFIDYWDDVINIWLGKKDKIQNKDYTVKSVNAQRLNKDRESYYKRQRRE